MGDILLSRCNPSQAKDCLWNNQRPKIECKSDYMMMTWEKRTWCCWHGPIYIACNDECMHECILHALQFKLYLGILQFNTLSKEQNLASSKTNLPCLWWETSYNQDATRPKPRIVYETTSGPRSNANLITWWWHETKKDMMLLAGSNLYSLQRWMHAWMHITCFILQDISRNPANSTPCQKRSRISLHPKLIYLAFDGRHLITKMQPVPSQGLFMKQPAAQDRMQIWLHNDDMRQKRTWCCWHGPIYIACNDECMHECILHALFFKIYLGILQIQHLVKKGAESRFIQN